MVVDRRIALFVLSTVAVVVLLFTYRTSRGPSPAPAAATGPAPVGVVSQSSDRLTVNGTVAPTVWGPVQVQVTVDNGRITDIKAIVYPNGNGHDQQINSTALPKLHDRVIAAQSADIDAVTGATVTSNGYTQSLQAALDAAHFQ